MKHAFVSVWICIVVAMPAPANAQSGFRDEVLTRGVGEIFKTSCSSCHGGGLPIADFDVLDLDRILRGTNSSGGRFVNREKPDESYLYQRVAQDQMPPGPRKLSTDEKQLILNWLSVELHGSAIGVQRAIVTEKNVFDSVFADLSDAPPGAAQNRRYVSLHNVWNDPSVDAATLDTYRQAISKAVNSLSWQPTLFVPLAIDKNPTVFRIELDKLGWSVQNWDRVASFYPYLIYRNNIVENAVNAATGTSVPVIRADWFVSAATKPPLYHEFLQLPATDADLEKRLGVDVSGNITAGQAIRAGFRGGRFGAFGSGVSDHNRLIERHTSKFGAYWKSYDFSSSDGDQDLLNRPLGPGTGPFAFRQAGGEIIFSLPNGLQAYLIVDSEGRRIDSAPEIVVRDRTNGSRAVVNGSSCIACHADGMNRQFDQVASHVVTAAFEPNVISRVEALFRPRSELTALFDADERRFRAALDTLRVTAAREPVSALIQYFEKPITTTSAAGELGLAAAEFAKRLSGTPELGKLKAGLDGGGVPREGFIQVFRRIVEDLGVGTLRMPSSLSAFAQLRARQGYTCVSRQDGALSCWGRNDRGQATPPVGLNVRSFSMSDQTAVALTPDATVVQWGMPVKLPIDLRPKLIDSDGCYVDAVDTVACWKGASPPAGLKATFLASVDAASCAIRTDSVVVCWGDLTAPGGITAKHIAIADDSAPFACAVRLDDTVSCWGRNAPNPGMLKVKAIDIGDDTLCAIGTDSVVKCFTAYGDRMAKRELPYNLKAAQIAVGSDHACALLTDSGTIRCWGDSSDNKLAAPAP